jgi:hypothetical protein
LVSNLLSVLSWFLAIFGGMVLSCMSENTLD